MKIKSLGLEQKHNKNISFKAREYAVIKTTVNGITTNLKAYEIGFEDKHFLDLMASKLNLLSLYGNKKIVTPKQNHDWLASINNAIMMAGFNEPQHSFLLTKDKRPCGIMSYKNLKKCYLDYIVTWPFAKGATVKLAGKSMIKMMYEDCIESNTSVIMLDLLDKMSQKLKTFYKSLDFIENKGPDSMGCDMYISRHNFMRKSRELDAFINVEKVKNSKQINLKEVLDIDFNK